MIDWSTALACIAETVRPLPIEQVALIEADRSRILSHDVLARDPSPPVDKSLRDGFALRAADGGPGQVLRVVESIAAGQVATRRLAPGEAARIMTGAPLPAGADCVVMREDTSELEPTADGLPRVRLDTPQPPHAGDWVLAAGAVFQADQVVLPAGQRLTPMAVGVLAEVGRGQISVVGRPRVAVLTTGDELVEPDTPCGPGQIHNSNRYVLGRLVRDDGWQLVANVHVGDDRAALSEQVAQLLNQADVLLVTGGVSAGDADYVPGVLRDQGVSRDFHKVRIKPGQPLWFGHRDHNDRRQLVFGLPGNPVSVLACYRLFARLALRRLAGEANATPDWVPVRLTQSFSQRGDRAVLYPARLETTAEEQRVTPLDWLGSPDLLTVARAQALLLFDAGTRRYDAGTIVPALVLNCG